MAVQLTIDITDSEQARLTEIIDELLPGKTPAEVKTLLEKQAKKLLLRSIKGRVQQVRFDTSMEDLDALRAADDAALPEPVTELP